jgi:hypothetical protein
MLKKRNELTGFVRSSRIPLWVRDLMKIVAEGIQNICFQRNEPNCGTAVNGELVESASAVSLRSKTKGEI